MKLCFATNNTHKFDEVAAALDGRFELVNLADMGCTEELPETGDTLEANSHQKAAYLHQHYGVDCFADDTGLEVEALGGEPGVYSARYAGPQRNATDNVQLLLKNLKGKTDRSARFRAVFTLILAGATHQFEGVVTGQIIHIPRGSEGFGYDPVFVPDGYDRTFAEMNLVDKNGISHRTRALQKLVDFLTTIAE
ncbi:MAG: non-canonical purine NTP diphosphatase [Cytophagaceae bacterium]|nr:non-canonical purine NTP diphosphatase [Cytophagaceae bacterium]